MATRRQVTRGNLAVAVWLFAAWSTLGSSAAAPKRVLILDSYGRDVTPYSTVASAFRTALTRELGETVDLYQISLELAWSESSDRDDPLVEMLRRRFEVLPADLVVPVGAPAVRFAARHREQLFPNTPLLFTAADSRLLPTNPLPINSAVVTQRIPLPAMVEEILRLQPATSNIVVIFGSSPLERFWERECRREFRAFAGRVQFTWLNDLTLEQVLKRCSALPSNSFVLLGLYVTDTTGVPYDNEEALRRLHAVANAPIFGGFSGQFGLGIVGGQLFQEREIGFRAACTAVRILRGEKPSSIAPEIVSVANPVYDWRELQRWGISESRLPAGSVIQFRRQTIWQEYRWRIVGLAVLILGQSLLIIALIVSWRRRRESEARMDLAAHAANAGLWILNLQTKRYWVTRKTRELFGFSPEDDVTVERVFSLIHPEDRKRVLHAQREVVETGLDGYVEYRVVRSDGSMRWISSWGRVSGSTSGRPASLMGVTIDVTERRQSEADLRSLSQRLIRAHEEERSRVARELHDDVAQRLALLAIDADGIESGQNREVQAETIESVREGLAELSADLRALSHRLHPSSLEIVGLAGSLKAEGERFSRRESIRTDVKIEGVPAGIPHETALCLLRVAQEAMTNSARHSRARTVEVQLRLADEGLQLTVRDDGVGFDPAAQRNRPTLGLSSMRERMLLANGELRIESAPGQGTVVTAWVPLKQPHPQTVEAVKYSKASRGAAIRH